MRRPPLSPVIVVCGLLVGCTAGPDGEGAHTPGPPHRAEASASTEPTAGPTTEPTTGPPTPTGTEVSSGGVTLTVSAPTDGDGRAADLVHEEDGTVTIRVDSRPAAPATITLGSPGRLRANGDSSVTILDDDATPVAGLSPVAGAAALTAVDPTTVRVDPSADETTLRTALGTDAVESTAWGEREGGRSLAVGPTGWARSAGEAGTDLVWAELVAADPEVDTSVMHDQLVCHSIGAPDKETWNLEPWRPDVGLFAVLADRCNPTA